MKRIELLAPAGDLGKAKLALLYGADAIYIGGKAFSLRYFASNFTLQDIQEIVGFAHNLNKKVYITCNMVMHDENIDGLKEYLEALHDLKVDGIIISSLYILKIAQEIGLECHMSTQLSILNKGAIDFYHELGATRLVLGRECSLKEIKELCSDTSYEIEVFIHGGMCSSYSGKCLLSLEMTGRDPNRGGCAHSCRWKYHLNSGDEQLFADEDYLSMSSKDLCAIKEIPELIESGVASLKIEGRMKSHNYLACIISAYRKAIDDYYDGKRQELESYQELIQYGENRLTGHGFLYGNVTKNEMLETLNDNFDHPGEFVGIVSDNNLLEVKNKIKKGETYIKISPNSKPEEIKILSIKYKDNEYDVYTVAKDLIAIETDKPLKPYDLLHKIIVK